MGEKYNDLTPRKIDATRDVLAYTATKLVDAKALVRIGITVFFSRAYPLIGLTRDREIITRSINRLRVLGEGSAPGDGLIEAVKMLRRGGGTKKAIIVTDGGFNEGVPLDIAALYAANSNVVVDVVVLGDFLSERDQRLVEFTVKICNGELFRVANKAELIRTLYRSSSSFPENP